jgi:indolepyruvate ferredoxin oxidoreductase
MMSVFKVLAKLKRLRGTPFDIFGYAEDRKLERQLLSEYEQLVEELLRNVDARNYDAAVELALLPAQMRGFGHVKDRHVKHAKRREAELLEKFRTKAEPEPPRSEGVEHSVVIMAG